MGAWAGRIPSLLLGLALAGCTSTPTQVVVLVDAEDEVRARAERLQIVVEGRAERNVSGEVVFDETTDLEGRTWPIKVALKPKDGDADRVFKVTARARMGGEAIVAASLVSTYVSGELRWIRLMLEDSCLELDAACSSDDDETCHEGGCVPAWIGPEELGSSSSDPAETVRLLPPADGPSPGADGGTGSIDAGADMPDAATSDAGMDDEPSCPEEACDGSEDEDCDGSVDEGCSCSGEEERDCGSDEGECELGVQSCSDGTWGACEGQVGPAEEECDDLDNDCDGTSDEAVMRACGSDVGLCELGTQTCDGGDWGLCLDAVEPVVQEVCDAMDQDCDGYSDEGEGCSRTGATFDALFGADPLFANGTLRDMDVGPDGDLAVSGYGCTSTTGGEGCSHWVAKLNADLTIDWSNAHHSGFTEYQYFNGAEGRGVAVDSEGAVVTAGSSCDGGVTEDCRIWVRKYSADGQTVVFTDVVDAGSEAWANGVDVDHQDNIVVTGFTSETFAERDIWTRKYAPDGTVLWTRMYNSTGSYNDVGNAVAVDSGGSVIVVGTIEEQGTETAARAWVRKYDPDGGTLWTAEYDGGSTNWAEARAVATDGQGNVFVLGRRNDPGDNDGWIQKYDMDGNTTQSPRLLNVSALHALATDETGAVVGVGHQHASGESSNLWVRRWNNELSAIWTRTYDQAMDTEEGYGVAIDDELNVYACGWSRGTSSTFLVRVWGP